MTPMPSLLVPPSAGVSLRLSEPTRMFGHGQSELAGEIGALVVPA